MAENSRPRFFSGGALREHMGGRFMVRGIAIFGPNGAGKSSITHALAKALGCAEMDVEDYYFPEQSASRQKALEGEYSRTAHLGTLPYSVPRTKEEVQSGLLRDIPADGRFILSGVTMNWTEDILSRLDIAFWVRVPLEIRLQRIASREEKRFGDRVRPGGDMYEQQKDFRAMVEGRDPKTIEQTALGLKCPVYPLDGTLPVAENVARIMAYLEQS